MGLTGFFVQGFRGEIMVLARLNSYLEALGKDSLASSFSLLARSISLQVWNCLFPCCLSFLVPKGCPHSLACGPLHLQSQGILNCLCVPNL